MGTKLKTEVVDMVNDLIEWNTTINLGITIPAVSKTIEFAIKDKDLMKENYLGAFSFSVYHLMSIRVQNEEEESQHLRLQPLIYQKEY